MKWIGSMMSVLVLFLVTAAATPAEAPGYHVIKKVPLGGNGGWDYLTIDPAAHRLYIARSDRVMVVDVEDGKLVGTVSPTPGVHGVALVPDRKRGFSSNGRDNTVTVFDLDSLKEITRLKVGRRPDAIIYDPSTKRVFTCNASGSLTAIDADNEKVIDTIELGGKPEFAAADGKGHVFINLENKNEIVAVDAEKLKVLHHWSIAPGEEPAGLAMDTEHGYLFSSCHNQMMAVVDAHTGKILATPKIGRGTDACKFDPGTGYAFSSNGDGTLTVVHSDGKGGFEVAETVKTERGARTMTLDPKTHQIYLVTAKARRGQRRSYEPGSFVLLVVGRQRTE